MTQYGLVWPMPGAELAYPQPHWVTAFAKAGFTHVRFDLPVSRDRDNAAASVQTMLHGGLQPIPILAWPFYEPDVAAMEGYARWYAETFPDTEWVTIGNEPWILDKIPADEYLRIAIPMANVLLESSEAKVIIAMDLFDHVDGGSRNWPGVEDVIGFIASSTRLYADIHPYRNPYRPSFSPWGSRTREHNHIMNTLGHDRYIIGETGWKPNEGDRQANGEYHVEELTLNQDLGVPLICIYCHIGDLINPSMDFGLWLADQYQHISPRPAAMAVSHFLKTL